MPTRDYGDSLARGQPEKLLQLISGPFWANCLPSECPPQITEEDSTWVFFCHSWEQMKAWSHEYAGSAILHLIASARALISPPSTGPNHPDLLMKITHWLAVFSVVFAMSQPVSAGPPASVPMLGAQSASRDGYSIVERGAHHRKWARVTSWTNALGRVTTRTNSYTELAAGMHYLAAGQWIESREVIESVPGGALARQGQLKVQFANDLATAGAIDLETPDGKHLTSHVFGLCYFDAASGTNVLIAGVTNSVGRIVGPNQVVYENAFDGLSASVRYTYTRGGFEQDILLHEVPAPPSAYGLDPASTRLVVMTEFLNPPQPAVRQALSKEDGAGIEIEDETLDFGSLQIGVGNGFPLGTETRGANLKVFKQWAELEGRRFLLEQVPVKALFKAIDSLPRKEGASLQSNTSAIRFTARSGRLPLPQPRKADSSAMELASRWVPEKSYVLDYATVVSTNNFVFRGDTSYYVSGNVTLGGSTTIEGGTVIKFTTNAIAQITLLSRDIRCLTSAYRPAVFTSGNDDSIGEIISGSTGHPAANGNVIAMSVPANGGPPAIPAKLNNLRISYVGVALSGGIGNYELDNIQVVNCGTGFCFDGNGAFRNVLLYNVSTGFCAIPDPCYIVAEHLTAHNVTRFCGSWEDADLGEEKMFSLGVTNSLIVGCAALGADGAFVNSIITNSGAGIFQTAGAGFHYLASNSPYRNAGTTNLPADLLQSLRQRTTHPPIVYSNVVFTQYTTLYPQAQRDSDVPDLGYHYPAIDYLASCCVSNATLALSNGVVVAFSDGVGIWLNNGAQLVSCGTPNSRNYFVEYNLVQEQPLNLAQPYGIAIAMPINTYHADPTRNPSISLRFTSEIFAPGTMYAAYTGYDSRQVGSLTLQDCEVYAAGASWYQDTDPASSVITLKNNLFENASIDIWSAGKVICSNNLFVCNGRWFMSINVGAESYAYSDNAFDNSTVYVDGNRGHNAFLNGSTLEYGDTWQTDIVTNLAWVAGPLGNYYQPTNSPLANRGSVNADLVGLYHYTTQTNQVKETNSVVDIGVHYLAVDGNGGLVDTDGDGTPDYMEDANGNGACDIGERDWNSAPVIIGQPISQTVSEANSAAFTAVAIGSPPLGYQWRRNSVTIPGATNSSLSFGNVRFAEVADYCVVIANAFGSVTSTVAALNLESSRRLLNIDFGTEGLSLKQGSAAIGLRVDDYWNAPLGMETNSGAIGGPPGLFLSDGTMSGIEVVPEGLNSAKSMGRCADAMLDTWAGNTNTQPFTLSVSNLSAGTYDLCLYGLGAEDNAFFSVEVTPGGASYPTRSTSLQAGWDTGLWQEGVQFVRYTNVQVGSGQKLQITVDAGNEVSLINGLQLLLPAGIMAPVILTQPIPQMVGVGAAVEINVVADGSTPLLYQWYLDGQPLSDSGSVSGSHAATLSLANVEQSQAGAYYVVVSNCRGSAVSETAALRVDSSTGMWVRTGSLHTNREFHTATLLTNGQVLVTGGDDGGAYLACTELCNPAHGNWTVVNPMNSPRSWFRASRLTNGQVLAVGGFDGSSILSSTETFNPLTTNWTLAGPMNSTRLDCSTTLLRSGEVLAVGGMDDSYTITDSAELFNPTTRTWALTGSMHIPRAWFTATTLTNGSVLVVGGDTGGGAVASSELYDPVTGNWTLTTGSLSVPRELHTATMLPDGRVLVAGGYNEMAGGLATAEVFDPNTQSWSPASSLVDARYYHAAVLLRNGQVLLAGGYDGGGTFHDSAELYDPVTRTSRLTGAMNTRRAYADLTLLANGKVLTAGGADGPGPNVRAEIYTPCSASAPSIAAPPKSRKVCPGEAVVLSVAATGAGPMNYQWLKNGVRLSDNEHITGATNAQLRIAAVSTSDAADYSVIVANEGGATNSAVATLALSGPATIDAPPLSQTVEPGSTVAFTVVIGGDGQAICQWYFGSQPLSDGDEVSGSQSPTLTLRNVQQSQAGSYYVVTSTCGGSTTSSTATLTVSTLTGPWPWPWPWPWPGQGPGPGPAPAAGVWVYTDSAMGASPHNHTATLLSDGKVLVAGGGAFLNIASAELYDPVSRTWNSTGSLNSQRSWHVAARLSSGQVLVAGGVLGVPISSAEIFTPAIGTWTNTGSMTSDRVAGTATLLPTGKVLVAGGLDGGYDPIATAELFDPASGSWTPVSSMHVARAFFTATLLTDGRVLVVGGYNGYGGVASAELYDPATGNWTFTAGPLSAARESHTATLLSNGKVLVAGGYDNGALAGAELYDPITSTWSSAGTLSSQRYNHVATILGTGEVLVAGGKDAYGNVYQSAEIYHPGNGTWTMAASMNEARESTTVTLLNDGRALVCGGLMNQGQATSTAELYWIYSPPAPVPFTIWITQPKANANLP